MEEYSLESGKYYFINGRLAKVNIETDQLEQSLAAKYSNPYNYNILEATTVGTNDCIVITQSATSLFLQR